jgi:hypothetical protein
MVRSKPRLFCIPDRRTDRQTDGYANSDSYVQNLRVFIFQTDRQTDGQMDGQTDIRTEKLIRCGLGTLSVPSGMPAVRGLEELFSAVLERFLQPIHALRA